MKKRYALVMVNICPKEFEEGEKNSRFCPEDGDCEKCRYGDTKEQLIRKVAQIIFKAWFEDKLKPNCEKIPFEIAVAKEIVEFLGVK